MRWVLLLLWLSGMGKLAELAGSAWPEESGEVDTSERAESEEESVELDGLDETLYSDELPVESDKSDDPDSGEVYGLDTPTYEELTRVAALPAGSEFNQFDDMDDEESDEIQKPNVFKGSGKMFGKCHSGPEKDSPAGSCQACNLYGEMRQLSLAIIKEQVLARLGFAHAPNTTGRVLPSVPRAILLQYERENAQERDMQSDQPQPAKYSYYHDDNSFYSSTEKVIALPR